MKLTAAILKKAIDEINERYKGNYLSYISLVNKKEILFSFSFHKNEILFISFNPLNPYIYYSNEIKKIETYPCLLNETLRKQLQDAYLENVSQINEDRVICFTFKKRNDYYELETKKLIIELVPNRTNLLLLDEKDIIQFAATYTSIETNRPIIKGEKYVPFLNNLNKSELSNEDYLKYKDEVLNHYYVSIENRKRERFKPILTKIKGRIKSLNKKSEILNKDIAESKKELIYQEYANTILTLQNEKEQLNEYINSLNLNGICKENDSIYDLTNRLFKKYKKAKTALIYDEVELKKIDQEIKDCLNLLDSFTYLDETDLEEINNEYHFLKTPLSVHKTKKKERKTQFSYIEFNNKKIAFGKSAKQNELLTFSYAKKDNYYFHIANDFGSHVVILSNEIDKIDIQTAAEICLLLSNKIDGEVYYTKIKNVKKGDKPGLAFLKVKESVYIKNINPKTKDLLLTMKRMSN